MRVLILSDIHGNLPALETVLSDAGSFDALWNLGDTVGYGPWPNECVQLVRSYAEARQLSGNHDLAAIGRISTNGFNAVASTAAEWTARHLDDSSRKWLADLPSTTIADDVTLAHGSPRSPVLEYILSSGDAAENFAYFKTSVCFVGHTHVPMIASEGLSKFVGRLFVPSHGQSFDLTSSRYIVNPGGVGQPRDNDPRAAYALYDSDNKVITFKRVKYPIEVVQDAIRLAGLPNVLGDRLAVGR